MGQAKRRGTFEERKAAAIAKKHDFAHALDGLELKRNEGPRRRPNMAVALIAAAMMKSFSPCQTIR